MGYGHQVLRLTLIGELLSQIKIVCVIALPCLALHWLAPRGAVGARHDGLPRQFSPLLPVVCHGLSLSEGFSGPLYGPSTVPCSITLDRPSDLFTCPYHFSLLISWMTIVLRAILCRRPS